MKQILLVLSCPWKWASKAVDSVAHSFIFWDKMAFQISSEIGQVRDRFDQEWQFVPIVDYLLSGKVVQVSIGYWHWKEIIIVIPDPSATLDRNWREHAIEGSRQLAIGIYFLANIAWLKEMRSLIWRYSRCLKWSPVCALYLGVFACLMAFFCCTSSLWSATSLRETVL